MGGTLTGDVGSTRTEQGTYWFEYGAGATLDRTSPAQAITFTVADRAAGVTFEPL